MPNAFTAYRIHDAPTAFGLEAAALERDWMSAAAQRFPYRCLPLNIANQHGWVLTCPVSFRVYWYGGAHPNELEFAFDGTPDPCIVSHFGAGVLTFSLPYLFRTPPGLNLWVKGPSNWIKDGIQALEGVVETDWATSTFTMNWKLTRPNEWITFAKGEPICMIVPVPRGLLEELNPKIVPLSAEPELLGQYKAWEASRSGFLEGLKVHDPDTLKQGWQKDYFRGRTEAGSFEPHQTRVDLKEFEKRNGETDPAG